MFTGIGDCVRVVVLIMIGSGFPLLRGPARSLPFFFGGGGNNETCPIPGDILISLYIAGDRAAGYFESGSDVQLGYCVEAVLGTN
jgi:hypothetical protein